MSKNKNSHSGHGWMMLVCCIVMFAGFFFLHGSGGNWGWLIIVLCPLMHLFMMKGMSHDSDSHHHEKDNEKK